MPEYTVGQVAAAINVGLLFLQMTMPLLLVLLLVGLIHKRNTAVTWSVTSRLILSTFWPTLLSCDTAAGRCDGVDARIVFTQYLGLGLTFLIATAGVLTPIGLGEGVSEGPLVNATFDYAIDPTVFGKGTPLRQDYHISRVCGRGQLPCPGVTPNDTIVLPGFSDQIKAYQNYTASGINSHDTWALPDAVKMYQIYVAENITECFGSGTTATGDLRMNPFEIQFRQYWTAKRTSNETKRLNTTGDYSILESLVLLEKLEAREGVIVDAVNGGIGFRNHTVPVKPQMNYGATWTEDLLWIEPVSVCVDTNWTMMTQPQLSPFAENSQSTTTEIVLVYRGDMKPSSRTQVPSLDTVESQFEPALKGRAVHAAEIFASSFFRIFSPYLSQNGSRVEYTTNSSRDSLEWALPVDGRESNGLYLGYLSHYKSLLDNHNPYEVVPEIVDIHNMGFNLSAFNMTDFYRKSSNNFNHPTDFKSSADIAVWVDVLSACNNYPSNHPPSINSSLIQCGYAIPPPVPEDDGYFGNAVEQRSKRPIHVCATSVRATVKETSFRYSHQAGGVPSLADLQVIGVQPKKYSRDSEKPIWGMENPGENWNVSDIHLIWGLVDGNKYRSSKGLWTVQSESLYLPSFVTNAQDGTGFGDSMGASRGPGQALHMTYEGSFSGYHGIDNYRMLLKWRNLSASSTTMASIPNLIWTDIAANMLVGTKSLTDAFPSTKTYQVRLYERKITYKYVYAIPGFLCWASWATAIAGLLLLLSFPDSRERMRPSFLKHLINRLSVGRVLADGIKTKRCSVDAPTREWIRKAGRVEIDLWEESCAAAVLNAVDDTTEGSPAPATEPLVPSEDDKSF